MVTVFSKELHDKSLPCNAGYSWPAHADMRRVVKGWVRGDDGFKYLSCKEWEMKVEESEVRK